MSNTYTIVTFETTHQALMFEKILQANGIEVKLMPIPREISSSCGTAARIPDGAADKVKQVCEEQEVIYEKIHTIELNKNHSWFGKFLKK